MSDMSDYLKNKLLDHSLGVTAYTMPTVYLALYTVMPTATTSGTEVVTGVGYARQSLVIGSAVTGASTNTNSISFGPNTTTNWGDVVGAAVVDDPTIAGGNVLYFQTLDVTRSCFIGDRIEFDPGDLTFEF